MAVHLPGLKLACPVRGLIRWLHRTPTRKNLLGVVNLVLIRSFLVYEIRVEVVFVLHRHSHAHVHWVHRSPHLIKLTLAREPRLTHRVQLLSRLHQAVTKSADLV